MAERKPWTLQEDKVLRTIILQRKITKWCAVSRTMEVEYKIVGRTGKQCRERWHNQLNPDIKTDVWSKQEEDILFNMHDRIGNSWAKISKELKGRTDNCIKNHFYSTLRKAVRRLNRFISDGQEKGNYKLIKNIMLSKIITVAEQKIQKRLNLPKTLIDLSSRIKNSLITIARKMQDNQRAIKSEQLKFAIQLIIQFSQSYKKKDLQRVEAVANMQEQGSQSSKFEQQPQKLIKPRKRKQQKSIKTNQNKQAQNIKKAAINTPVKLLTDAKPQKNVNQSLEQSMRRIQSIEKTTTSSNLLQNLIRQRSIKEQQEVIQVPLMRRRSSRLEQKYQNQIFSSGINLRQSEVYRTNLELLKNSNLFLGFSLQESNPRLSELLKFNKLESFRADA